MLADEDEDDYVSPTSLEDLVLLKGQLRASLADIEFHENAVIESLRPKTPAEVDFVRRHLQEALAELEAAQPPEQQPPS
ncbi:hypothetical protein OG756_02140 [Streptomyces sp. NBC_01310]|uniref:hypothetical protein n=1 Tax=Streptomyces sp. NBC_01310 TaxID=2903820 RepID=UPI0035B586EC|nr:hypothetical protein OG756_02140 [Streptomyces sp. NBC_01310]